MTESESLLVSLFFCSGTSAVCTSPLGSVKKVCFIYVLVIVGVQ